MRVAVPFEYQAIILAEWLLIYFCVIFILYPGKRK